MEKAEVEIRRYEPKDEARLFALLERAGEEWTEYCQGAGRTKYQQTMAHSLGYLLMVEDELCGYVRCRDDDGYGVYVYDLLVDEKYRGKAYGRTLMERVCEDFPEDTVYVMSDVDPYYEKLGYQRVGSIFMVREGCRA